MTQTKRDRAIESIEGIIKRGVMHGFIGSAEEKDLTSDIEALRSSPGDAAQIDDFSCRCPICEKPAIVLNKNSVCYNGHCEACNSYFGGGIGNHAPVEEAAITAAEPDVFHPTQEQYDDYNKLCKAAMDKIEWPEPDSLEELLVKVPEGHVVKFWPPSKISPNWDCVIKPESGMVSYDKLDIRPKLGIAKTPSAAIRDAMKAGGG